MTAEEYLANQATLKLAKLRQQTAYVFENSEFFRSRLQAAGVNDPRDVDSMNAFRALPVIMTKDDHRTSQSDSLQQHGHSFGMHLCAPLDEVIHVAATSGTSGNPTFYTFTRKDQQITHEVLGRLFRMATIRPGDTVLQAFGLSMWLAGVTVIQALEAYGARPIAVGAEAGIAKILRYIQLTKPRVLMATPSLATHLIERSEQEIGVPVGELGIEVLACAGEPGAGIPAVRQRLMDEYGAMLYDFTGGAWHNGTISCNSEQHHGMHYMAEDYCFRYDLIDPQTKQPLALADGVVGEAIHTALEYQAGPAFRNATGDLLKLYVNECPGCGEFGARIDIIGRVDDLLNIKGVKVYPAAIKSVVAEFQPDVSGQIQILLDGPPPRVPPPLKLTIELDQHATNIDQPALATRIQKRISELLKVPTTITIVPFAALARSNLKTKMIIIKATES